MQNKMPYALVENRAGKYPEPTIGSFQAAAANADWKNSPGYYVVLVNEPGDESWPITGASFILIHKEQENAQMATALLRFFDWCYHHGAEAAESLDYVPIPLKVVDLVEATWNQELRSGGKSVAH
jgi:phosphate transport system substrate-binding protein